MASDPNMQDRIEFQVPDNALIDGQWVAERCDQRFSVLSPASASAAVVGRVADSSPIIAWYAPGETLND